MKETRAAAMRRLNIPNGSWAKAIRNGELKPDEDGLFDSAVVDSWDAARPKSGRARTAAPPAASPPPEPQQSSASSAEVQPDPGSAADQADEAAAAPDKPLKLPEPAREWRSAESKKRGEIRIWHAQEGQRDDRDRFHLRSVDIALRGDEDGDGDSETFDYWINFQWHGNSQPVSSGKFVLEFATLKAAEAAQQRVLAACDGWLDAAADVRLISIRRLVDLAAEMDADIYLVEF